MMQTVRGSWLKLGLGIVSGAALTLGCLPPPGPGTGGTGGSAGSAGNGGTTGSWCNVAQVLQQNCSTCHGSTPQFGAPMPLVTQADLTATRNGQKVYNLVLNRIGRTDATRMPPLPNAALSAEAINTVQAWVNAGAPAAPAGQACTGTGGSGGSGGEAPFPSDCKDFYTVRAHGQPVVGDTSPMAVPTDGSLGNKYKCFYFTPPYQNGAQALHLRSLFDKSDLRYVHHWILYGRDTPSHAPGTISDCSAAEPGAYFITGWAPGSNPLPLPSDVGIALPPTTGELALEIHYYNPNSDPGRVDATGVEFCTAPPNTRPHTAAVSFTGSEGICIEPLQQKDVVGQCVPQTNQGDIHIVGVAPHMHQYARGMTIMINRANGTKEVLHDEPFDFNTQTFWAKDAVVHPGDTLTTTCHYQNTSSGRVHFGERTQDEMCYGFITAWPVGALQSSPDIGTMFGPFIGLGQPTRRCMDGASILQSCNGISDYPKGN